MSRYRARPRELEAMQFVIGEEGTGRAIAAWAGDEVIVGTSSVSIYTPHGLVIALPGEYVVRDTNGGFYPCRADIFESNYEPL
jgi:hypothetical protein